MTTVNKFLATEKDTIKLGVQVAKQCKPGDIICLIGDLGSGKTTFVKGLAKGLKINPDDVRSPTFVLMNSYEGRLPVFHFDLYRLGREDEIVEIGYDEFLYGDGVAVLEWAENLGMLSPKNCLTIKLLHKRSGGRNAIVKAVGKGYERFILGK